VHNNNFSSSPIDHYIQADIVNRLYGSDVLAFSDLKQDDVENSLFMYHMHKLIDRGVVEKTNQGFKLTLKGVRWVNYLGPRALQPIQLPRLLINFILTDPSRAQILLSRRLGPSAGILNEYLLPGGLYPYGVSGDTACKEVAASMGLADDLMLSYVAMLEKVNTYNDGYTQHTVSKIFTAVCVDLDPKGTEYFALEWVQIEDVLQNTNGTYDKPLQQTVELFTGKKHQPFTTLTFSE